MTPRARQMQVRLTYVTLSHRSTESKVVTLPGETPLTELMDVAAVALKTQHDIALVHQIVGAFVRSSE